jgi:16S rRNA (adenine(1408)-N(1))-methyltransferase
LVAKHAAVTVDLGTGDGRYVYATAAAEPDRLVIGVDANATAMAETSRRAASNPQRGGLPNALFVVAAVEALTAELNGVADVLTCHFPWGSLLRGLRAADPAIMTGMIRFARPGAALSMLLSATEQDRGGGVEPIDEHALGTLIEAYCGFGLAVTEARLATADEVVAARSSWAKRLGAGRVRPAWLLRAVVESGNEPKDAGVSDRFGAVGRT